MSTKFHAIGPLTRNEGLRDNVARHLLVAIFSGKINAGDRLVAQTLAAQLGVSATPIREALVELGSIGLIQNLPNRGAVCMPFGPRELQEMYQLRRILEVEATRMACGRLPVEQLRDLRIGMAKLAERKVSAWSDQAMELDEKLHGLIAWGCDNSRLQHELERYRDLMQAIREVVGNKQRVQLKAIEQHIEIIDALIENDPHQASQAMAIHIDTTAAGVERILFPQSA
jgi:DNA-binding GntR family transcriptional regulator